MTPTQRASADQRRAESAERVAAIANELRFRHGTMEAGKLLVQAGMDVLRAAYGQRQAAELAREAVGKP